MLKVSIELFVNFAKGKPVLNILKDLNLNFKYFESLKWQNMQ